MTGIVPLWLRFFAQTAIQEGFSARFTVPVLMLPILFMMIRPAFAGGLKSPLPGALVAGSLLFLFRH